MLLRCPSCDTAHELDEALFAGGSRRVRCASCREIWEASPPAAEPEPVDEPSWDLPESEAAPAAQTEVTQAELDAMFAEEAPPSAPQSAEESQPTPDPQAESAPEPAASGEPEPAKTDKKKRRREEDLPAMEVVQRVAIVLSEDAPPEQLNIKEKAQIKERAHVHHDAPQSMLARFATTIATSFVGMLIAFGVFRHDVVRVAPATAPIYEMIGLSVNTFGLEIHKLQSRMVYEDGREALEISGEIINITSSQKAVPVLRLSLIGGQGQDLYVWTGTAERQQLQAKEKTLFRRRLASPPSEATSVMVRFIAQDDIVAALTPSR